MQKKSCLLILFLIVVSTQLHARVSPHHDLNQDTNHNFSLLGAKIIDTFLVIGIIVAFAGVGLCCYCFRGVVSGAQNSSSRREVTVYAPQPPPNLQAYNIQHTNPTPPANRNQVFQYFQSQKDQKVNARPPPIQQDLHDSSNPYITKKQVSKISSQWQINKDRQLRLKLIQDCGYCGELHMQGRQPDILIQCPQDHCFHMKCLSDYRQKMTVQNGGNGINKCTACKGSYSSVVKIFCSKCQSKFISVNLKKFSDNQGAINRDIIISKYGQFCEECS